LRFGSGCCKVDGIANLPIAGAANLGPPLPLGAPLN